MTNPKVLILLVALVMFVNYINYILPDRSKQFAKITLLEKKIKKEMLLNEQKIDPDALRIEKDELFFNGKKLNYSQAMGKMQEFINESAKDLCSVKRLKWAQVPISEKWYDILRIDLALRCSAKDLFVFVNRLRSSQKLFTVENFRIMKSRRNESLQIALQLSAYRKKDEAK